ncbi:MAG: CBS domain-containing protein [Bdellovibrionales bacterium]
MNQLNLPVEEFTTPDPVTAPETMPIEEISAIMKECGIRHLPIVRDGKVVGLVSDRDLKVAMGLNRGEKLMVNASDIMVTDLVTINSTATLDQAAFKMSSKKIGSLLVNDENNNFLGIFTATDALNALIEIVRENLGD